MLQASLHARFSELGFKSWSIFDLEHVSALQAVDASQVLVEHRVRFCFLTTNNSVGAVCGSVAYSSSLRRSQWSNL